MDEDVKVVETERARAMEWIEEGTHAQKRDERSDRKKEDILC